MNRPKLIFSDTNGRIGVHPTLEPLGMKGGGLFRLSPKELIALPEGSTLFRLPGRSPVGYDSARRMMAEVKGPGQPTHGANCSAVAAFLSPGYTITHCSAYAVSGDPKPLPLFSYGVAAFYKGRFHTAALRIDRSNRHDPRSIDMKLVRSGIKKVKRLITGNRLVSHLERCATEYGCPGAQNFFLGRQEGPLPSSPICNARCLGCISYQSEERCPESQPRIKFVPNPEEIAQIALFHLSRVPNSVVSFGQGCEGEPLMASGTIEKAIRLIRAKTSRGLININTNASAPDALMRLFDAGLGSIRVSMNSAREEYYNRYYRPKGYAFTDVMGSIKAAKFRKIFVSINYLTMPGFTDSKDEFYAFQRFLRSYRPDMVQWRNLNFDPKLYFSEMRISAEPKEMIGIDKVIRLLRKAFPRLMMGYYNPDIRRINDHLKAR